MRVLVTGAAGKVGQALLARLTSKPPVRDLTIRALCHNRVIPEGPKLTVIKGSISSREVCRKAVQGVTHIVHLATCKETPAQVMDVTVKGLFWLLEEFRKTGLARRFVLLGGDAAVGHFHHKHPTPITEAAPYMAYPGCYALSKVLEEVMVSQFGVQYDLDWCCLRAPWIMEKDDFRHTLSFGEDVFGAPDWKTLVSPEEAERCRMGGTIPILVDEGDKPVKRNFIHVDDVVEAIVLALTAPAARQRLYNIAMNEPVDYGDLAAYLEKTRGLPSIRLRGPYVSNWLDNARAKAELGWRPAYDLARLVESAWTYERPESDPRKIWWPG